MLAWLTLRPAGPILAVPVLIFDGLDVGQLARNYHVLSVPIASISWGGILLPQTGEGDLGSPNVWGCVLSYLSTVVYHNANAISILITRYTFDPHTFGP